MFEGVSDDTLKEMFNKNKHNMRVWLVAFISWVTIGIAFIVFRDVVLASSIPKWTNQVCALVFFLGIFIWIARDLLLVIRQGDMEREMQRRNMCWNYSLAYRMVRYHDRKKS
jgi:hypothetical protein